MNTMRGMAWLLPLAGFTSHLAAQSIEAVDSLVAGFVENGLTGSWSPSGAFDGCPALDDWQNEAFDRLTSVPLSVDRTIDLAMAWADPLVRCEDQALLQWYTKTLDHAVVLEQGTLAHYLFYVLRRVDSPAVRSYLREAMLDTDRPDWARSSAGSTLFRKLDDSETLNEFLAAFAEARLPAGVAVAQARRLLLRNPDRLLAEIGTQIAASPALMSQVALTYIATNATEHATVAARIRFADSIESAVTRDTVMSTRQREWLGSAVATLRRGVH